MFISFCTHFPSFLRGGCLTLLSLLVLSGCTSMGYKTMPYQELAKKYTNTESKYMEVDGMTIHYRDEGAGPPLLLIHGVSSSLHTWDDWVDQLKDKYRVIRLDLPGFGLTGPDPATHDYDIDYLVNKVDGFMNQLGVHKFFIAGNSLGGYVAWNYALQNPHKLYKMVLMASAGYPQDMPTWIGFASWPVVNWVTPYMMPRFMVNWTIDSAVVDEDKVTEEQRERYFNLTMRDGNRRSYVENFKMLRRNMDDPTMGEAVKDVIVPTLLLWGEQDSWVPLDVMRQFHRDLSYSEYIIYEGIGHLPMEELPVQSARDANNFFMSELRKAQAHPQEDTIKFYDKKQYDFHMGQNEEL